MCCLEREICSQRIVKTNLFQSFMFPRLDVNKVISKHRIQIGIVYS